MQQRTRLYALLVQIWPKIYYAINAAFYFLITLLKNTVKQMINQIKGGF